MVLGIQRLWVSARSWVLGAVWPVASVGSCQSLHGEAGVKKPSIGASPAPSQRNKNRRRVDFVEVRCGRKRSRSSEGSPASGGGLVRPPRKRVARVQQTSVEAALETSREAGAFRAGCGCGREEERRGGTGGTPASSIGSVTRVSQNRKYRTVCASNANHWSAERCPGNHRSNRPRGAWHGGRLRGHGDIDWCSWPCSWHWRPSRPCICRRSNRGGRSWSTRPGMAPVSTSASVSAAAQTDRSSLTFETRSPLPPCLSQRHLAPHVSLLRPPQLPCQSSCGQTQSRK